MLSTAVSLIVAILAGGLIFGGGVAFCVTVPLSLGLTALLKGRLGWEDRFDWIFDAVSLLTVHLLISVPFLIHYLSVSPMGTSSWPELAIPWVHTTFVVLFWFSATFTLPVFFFLSGLYDDRESPEPISPMDIMEDYSDLSRKLITEEEVAEILDEKDDGGSKVSHQPPHPHLLH